MDEFSLKKQWREAYHRYLAETASAWKSYQRQRMRWWGAELLEKKTPEWANSQKVWEIVHSVTDDARRTIANCNLATLRLALKQCQSKTVTRAIEIRIRKLEKSHA